MNYMQGNYKIKAVRRLTQTVYDIDIHCPEMTAVSKPGQFVHIRCGEKTLRRPISICGINKQEGMMRLVYEVRGEGTAWLAQQTEGCEIDILGPLGNGFALGNTERKVLFVGGGIGVPPLLETSKAFGTNAVSILGFRNKEAVILKEDFENICGAVHITTDDGSCGHHGLVTDVLKDCLAQGGFSEIFACGPTPMLKGVSVLAKEYHVPCQVSLEERMGCGVGACLVCACKTREDGQEHMRHICKNGPVFNAEEVVW